MKAAKPSARGSATLFLRVRLSKTLAIGPGKMDLLERIDESGSISAAARAMRMSYRRAWLLVEEMNESFRDPVVVSQHGGPRGGGAQLTPSGKTLVDCYRRIQRKAASVTERERRSLSALVVRGG